MFDGPLEILVRQLASLPGLGGRSARRIALHLLSNKEGKLAPLLKSITEAASAINECDVCGNLDSSNPCRICRDQARDRTTICVVASVADLWAVERTASYRGQYHILGGVLSALDGVGPDDLTLDQLIGRLKAGNFDELVLALAATVDGQSTAHFIMDRLQDFNLKITRLAHGMPVGGALEYLDDSTIATALKSRARL